SPHPGSPGGQHSTCAGPQLRHVRFALSQTGRSEEHTSELQSLTNLVCRLLLEKKKKTHVGRSAHIKDAIVFPNAIAPIPKRSRVIAEAALLVLINTHVQNARIVTSLMHMLIYI